MTRLLLIPAIFLTGIASGLVAWFWLMAALLTGLNIGVTAIAAVACSHAFLCGLTLTRLKRGDDEPWTWIGPH